MLPQFYIGYFEPKLHNIIARQSQNLRHRREEALNKCSEVSVP